MRIQCISEVRRLIDMSQPCILTFVLFVVAAQGWNYMICSLLFLIPLIAFPREQYFCLKLNTSFHVRSLFTVIAFVFIVYEHFVIPQLEISFLENIVFVVLMAITAVTFYAVYTNRANPGSDGLLLSKVCEVCDKPSHHTDFHSLWFGCCIGRSNRKWYVISVGSLACALFDCSYLTLTTICRPYELVEDLILVPEDCSETFMEWQYSICFVSGVFSLIFSMVLFAVALREAWFISIGFSVTEWRNLPISRKLCLGLCNQRPHNKGFSLNWYSVLKSQAL